MESASNAVLNCQHLPCDCEYRMQKTEWESRNSEGVFRQLHADVWPRDHGRGHGVEMAGDEFRPDN